MFEAVSSPYLVPFDGSFRVADAPTRPPRKQRSRRANKARLAELRDALYDLQRILYAYDRRAVLLVFQAMDAAGKDSTIRHVLSGVNPAGCRVYSFKKPSAEELEHDFLWRTTCRLPERGLIGVFNRSYYEEVLVVRVHPELLDHQMVPRPSDLDTLWQERFESIRDHERHLARNGVVILKFWLNVSKDEQRRRFLDRLEQPHKNWKYEPNDVRERQFWDQYMAAYEDALRATSRPWAPWYAIPADDKPFMRACVADLIVRSLQTLDLQYPRLDPDVARTLDAMRRQLREEAPETPPA
ncbi:MAG: polyphosphate kinase 2 family protein [Bacteroidetes bacterium]|nr:MAG: polyphosphate kinase 2 family protein [Bacteroidota bacterium]